MPVVAIMADQPDNPYSVITLKKSGIDTPAKLKGKKISWFQALERGLLDPVIQSAGLAREDVELVTVGARCGGPAAGGGQVDALFGYSFGQALTLEQRGFPVNVMPVRDYGVQAYGTVIYTGEALLKSNPELVKRFLRATIKGFMYTHDNAKAAVDEVIKHAPDRELELETKKSLIIFLLYQVADYAERFGLMTDDKWQSSIDLFAKSGDLARIPVASEMYTNAVLNALPEAQALAKLVKSPPK